MEYPRQQLPLVRFLSKVVHEKRKNNYVNFIFNIFDKKNRFYSIKLISFYQKLQFRNRKALMCIGQIWVTVA